MKITIEIDNADGPAVTQSVQGAESSTPQSSAPPEIVARALALGASDGGAAPAEMPQAGAPPIPPAIAGLTAPAPAADPARGGAISAGAASVDAPQTPSQTVEQDPEAPSAPAEED